MKKTAKHYDIYAWACDLQPYRGEGILGINFLIHLSEVKRSIIYAESPESILIINKKKIRTIKKKNSKRINFSFIFNYLNPFLGIFKIWFHKRNEIQVCYVNFLPLWNFLLFLLLPKNTIFGPVTGGVYNGKVKDLNSFARKFILPICCKISVKIGNIRKFKFLFTTEILKKFINKKNNDKYFMNYNLINYNSQKQKLIKKNNRKVIDFIFYYRKYKAHNSNEQIKIITLLSKYKFNIVVVGDYLKLDNVINLGILPRKDIFKLLKKAKFSLNEGTNFFSIFCIDCISCGVKIFYDKKTKVKKFLFPKNLFYEINFCKAEDSTIYIKKNIENYKQPDLVSFDIKSYKKKYINYFN